MLFISLLIKVVAGVNTQVSSGASTKTASASRFTPSSLPLYPLDFQDSWQASRPIPVDFNYSVPNYGPRDLTKYLEEAQKSSELLTKQINERDWQDRSIENEENRADILLPYVRQRIEYAHRR
ncbi:hypothetical protein BBOV_II001715 [Babesia bovis T2Bo]|uniref:hypothetical protein n=1 Tax=Babesia bovis T2Bo TaxID=484906 RepID=UPI001C35875C|nr:hypothetical protein BBOV_II001715 [Babesia bovis T2Bo]KAG6440129.1 hypothetical protein BBOV_II001715 [Babesia bovis T2Bo]